MTTRNNRRDSIVQERGEDGSKVTLSRHWQSNAQPPTGEESAPFDPSSLPRLAAEPTNVPPPAVHVHPVNDAPSPRVIAPIDLSDFRALMDAAKAARERSAGYQQALQQAQVAELKAQGAFEGEYARLRRRYGIRDGEDFDPETGAIVVVQQG